MSLNEILITNIGKIAPKQVALHQPYEYDKYEVVNASQGNQSIVAFYSIHPGKSNYPYHYHTSNEEVFYIISGQGLLETPLGEIPVAAGDVIIIPPCKEGAHRIKNPSDSEVLCYLDVDTNNATDVAFYPHTGKIGVFTNGAGKFYKQDSNVGYYEGE